MDDEQQSIKLSYTAVGDVSGKEKVGFEFRLGDMSLTNVKKIEAFLLPKVSELTNIFQE